MEAAKQSLPRKARAYALITAALAAVVLARALWNWESPDLFKYAGFLLAAIATSGMRIRIPGITGTLSVTFLFVLFGLLELNAPETLLLGVLATFVQCCWGRTVLPRAWHTIFNVSAMALAIALAEQTYHASALASHPVEPPLRLAAATCVLFVFNTGPAAIMIALSEARSFIAVWRDSYFWSLPYYLGGAALAEVASLANQVLGWQAVLLSGPVMYLIYRSYRLYLERLENEKKHAEEVSSLHLRTIEALALAIDAKDHTTHDHLQRVQHYAMELAKDLGLTADEQEALRAASMLHDIGKLAVPEH
ncbi:MAG TPA: HD domain-containing protein, partial [Bryobacteraceae bacterium]|nr:HD domain-containing protein [Bryobacteraceae bacterium]